MLSGSACLAMDMCYAGHYLVLLMRHSFAVILRRPRRRCAHTQVHDRTARASLLLNLNLNGAGYPSPPEVSPSHPTPLSGKYRRVVESIRCKRRRFFGKNNHCNGASSFCFRSSQCHPVLESRGRANEKVTPCFLHWQSEIQNS